MMETIERDLAELEKMSAVTEAKISSIPHRKQMNRCLIIVNEEKKLFKAISWLKSHQINPSSVLYIQKFTGLSTPIVLKQPATAEVIVPPILVRACDLLKATSIPAYTLYAIPPMEVTTTAVSLLHHDVDLVLVVGCHCLSRGEYEQVVDFKPFIEEIILKEAIQPVILFK